MATEQNPIETASSTAARMPWVSPRVSRIGAGSAELAVGTIDDGVDKS